KHLKLIAVGLVVLLLLWGGSELLSRGSDSVTGSLALPALSQTDVDTISVVKGTDSIVLAKQSPTAWSVSGHRAAFAAVAEVFQALADTARPELVAQAPSSFARLGVDSAAGRWLRLRGGGKPLLELIIGTRATDFQRVYVRRPGDTHVYLWLGRLAAAVDRPVDGWRDKRIAALEPDSIVALDVVRGTDRYALTRSGERWALNGQATDSAAVARYLARLKHITPAGIAAPAIAPRRDGQPAARRGDGRALGAAAVCRDDPPLRRRGDFRQDRRERARSGCVHHPADQPAGGEPSGAVVPDRRGATRQRG